MRFSGLIPALKTGKIDLIISSMTETPERAQSIDFSDPYLNTGLCLLVKKDSPIQGIGDVDRPGVTVVVKQGTTGQAYARDHSEKRDRPRAGQGDRLRAGGNPRKGRRVHL